MQVFLSSPWIPPEWVRAHGLQPRLIGSAVDLGCEAQPQGPGICAFAEWIVRKAQAEEQAAIVFTTHCDQLRRGFDIVENSLGPRAFLFNVPATWQNAVAEKIFRAELERLGNFLIGLGGRVPDARQLGAFIEQQELARRHLLQAACQCSARSYAEAITRFHWDGTIQLPRPAETPPLSIPIALVGGAFSARHFELLDCIEHAGGRVALNATEAGERSLLRADERPLAVSSSEPPECAAATPEGPRPAFPLLTRLVNIYLQNGVDVFQRPNTRLYEWLRCRIEARGVRGLILWHFVGCDLWCAEAQSLREAFELPLLVLEPDDANGGSARLTNRIEAFMESLT
jgi:hypothetical protein